MPKVIYCAKRLYDAIRMAEENLTERELLIRDYIKVHPRCTKQALADYMNSASLEITSRASRVTVWKSVKWLVNEEIIIEARDEKNRQTRRLIVNDKSIFNETLEGLRSFEKAFFELLSKFKKFLEKRSQIDASQSNKLPPSIVQSILEIFSTMVETVYYQSRITWPRSVLDNEQLQKLYSFAFSRVAKIQSRLFSIWEEIDSEGNPFSYEDRTGEALARRGFDLGPTNIPLWAEYDLGVEADKVCYIVASLHTSQSMSDNLRHFLSENAKLST